MVYKFQKKKQAQKMLKLMNFLFVKKSVNHKEMFRTWVRIHIKMKWNLSTAFILGLVGKEIEP